MAPVTPLQESNAALAGTVVERLLSRYGRRAYFPKGIVAQSAEAGKKARRFNATAGMAFTEGHPIVLPSIRSAAPDLSPAELVGYSTTAGEPALRELWKAQMAEKNPGLAGVPTSLPLVTAGLTHGLSLVGDLFLDPGDVVVIPDLAWENYRLMYEDRREARFATFPFFKRSGGFNAAGLREALVREEPRGKAAVLLNFPNNPTGYSPTRDEAQEIVHVLGDMADRGMTILAIVDDAYFGLFFEEETSKESLFAYLASLHENLLAVKVDGSTKEDMVWGFRVGMLTYAARGLEARHYAGIENKTMGAIRATISMASRPAQVMLIKAMQKPAYRQEKAAAVRLVEEKYRKVKQVMASRPVPPVLEPLPFNSGYFMCFRLKRGSAEELRQRLLDQEGVGTIAMDEHLLRIAFSAVDPDQIEELFSTVYRTAQAL
jgi:aspartate/methionine/tyrosine aminotransferase